MERVKHLPFVAPIIEAFTNHSKRERVLCRTSTARQGSS